ncbi:gsl4238 [Gloeobacter violaceus PCC 7421]|uniref:Gsl4238 protein n=1 Tax=Gloeobacter violaceus (strain ATCC 29082 / PCC 7421) TaxID=251221 RepID=Q7NDJ7_GLOVI|nr:gsl4238 [Gloeobacter violaceus PCC 7421]
MRTVGLHYCLRNIWRKWIRQDAQSHLSKPPNLIRLTKPGFCYCRFGAHGYGEQQVLDDKAAITLGLVSIEIARFFAPQANKPDPQTR